MGSYFHGMSKPKFGSTGHGKRYYRLTSSSFNLTLYKTGLLTKADSFGFSVSQPLKFESGEINFSFPIEEQLKKKFFLMISQLQWKHRGDKLIWNLFTVPPIRKGYLRSRIGVSKDQGHISSDRLEPFFETSWEF
ncbi:MAG: hypothetical protein CM1200mP12_18560 [Gammaproteobacteria bacterium]|nr:MAG: hypothetical protein CM1200mP12_18560 [Gammaproteobacteria bacterium]